VAAPSNAGSASAPESESAAQEKTFAQPPKKQGEPTLAPPKPADNSSDASVVEPPPAPKPRGADDTSSPPAEPKADENKSSQVEPLAPLVPVKKPMLAAS
jgi:hypothetical protein